MANKKNKKENNDQLYVSMGDIASHSLPDDNIIHHSSSSASQFTKSEETQLRSIANNRIKLKSGFNKDDRYFHRPEEVLPTRHNDIIAACQAMYRKVGMIRNIIDLMADFAGEGLIFRHPIKSQQRFYEAWAKKTNISGRAHDFMKLLLRDANVIVRRKTAIITAPVVKQMTKAYHDYEEVVDLNSLEENIPTETPEKIKIEKRKTNKKEIPWQYTFISPVFVEKIGGEIGRFYGGNKIALRIPLDLASSIRKPKTNAEKELVNKLPAEIVNSIRKSKDSSPLVALDQEKTYVDYYEKDDWEDWGTPFLYGILEDVLLKEKMKMADNAALDGVINVTRLWKLGDHKEKILPTKAAVNKLLEMLQYNVSGGIKDIVWDSMIDYKVDYPPVDKILGDNKYIAVNRDIMKGLGIPEALVGGVDLATRNAETAFVQLKTLIERLEYVREKCVKWLMNEVKILAEAMGFRTLPSISFGTMSLRDEAKEKQLMIQLADRGLISVQALHEVFGTNFVTELSRLKEEQNIRDKNEPILERSSPYYRPKSQLELQHEFQIELENLKSGGDNIAGDQPRDSGDNQPGRPQNRFDTQPRDERTEKVLSIYKAKAEQILIQIDNIIDPLYLKSKNAKNIRSLTKTQSQELENMKFTILATIDINDQITQELINNKTKGDFKNLSNIFMEYFNSLLKKHIQLFGKSAKIGERRSMCCSTWAIMRYKGEK